MADTPHIDNDIAVFQPEGPLDAIGTLTHEHHLLRLLTANASGLRIDLAKVAFLDPSGLGLLVHAAKRARLQRWSYSIVNAGGQPAAMLASLNLLSALNVTATAPVATGMRPPRPANLNQPALGQAA